MVTSGDASGRPRGLASKVAATVWTIALLTVPGLGLVDLVSSFIAAESGAVLMLPAYALVIGVLMPWLLLSQWGRGPRAVEAARLLFVVPLAFLLTAALALRPHSLLGAGVTAAAAFTVFALHPRRAEIVGSVFRSDLRVALAAAPGIVTWSAFAWTAAERQRAGLPPREGFALGPDSWDAITLMAATIVLCAVSASILRRRGVAGVAAGGLTALFGVASLVRGDFPGHLPGLWELAALAWAGVMVVMSVQTDRISRAAE